MSRQTVSAVAPSTPSAGDSWMDTINYILKTWNSAQWIDVDATGV